jgi:hypothetical protein
MKPESCRPDQEGLAGGLVPFPSEQPLHLSRQRADDGPRCNRDGTERLSCLQALMWWSAIGNNVLLH